MTEHDELLARLDVAGEKWALQHYWNDINDAAAAIRSLQVKREVETWARDMLVYLDVDFESLPENEFKIYQEGYDKTVAGLREVLAPERTVAGQEETK